MALVIETMNPWAKKIVEKEKEKFGCYQLLDVTTKAHYIGVGDVRTRLLSHFKDGSNPCPDTSYYIVEDTCGEEEALRKRDALLKAHEETYGQLPKYNQKSPT